MIEMYRNTTWTLIISMKWNQTITLIWLKWFKHNLRCGWLAPRAHYSGDLRSFLLLFVTFCGSFSHFHHINFATYTDKHRSMEKTPLICIHSLHSYEFMFMSENCLHFFLGPSIIHRSFHWFVVVFVLQTLCICYFRHASALSTFIFSAHNTRTKLTTLLQSK